MRWLICWLLELIVRTVRIVQSGFCPGWNEPQVPPDTAVDDGKTPDEIAGLYEWWKADAQSFSDNDPATPVVTSVGGGNNLSEATNPPTFKTGIVNGLPVLRFDGTNDVLKTTNATPNVAQPITAFIVVNFSSVAGVRVIYDSTIGNRILSYLDTNLKIFAGAIYGSSASLSASTWYVIVSKFNTVNSFSRVNGTQSASGDAGAQSQDYNISVGASPDNSNPFAGDIAEIGFYSAALTDQEILDLELGFRTKYAITF